MRKPAYLSPTAVSKFLTDSSDYYMSYLTASRPPREPQTKPMSIGSAFDAYVKSHLHESLFGRGHKDADKYAKDTIFEAQVESHNRDWAKEAGQYVFDCYVKYGALADLMLELNKAVDEPRFEMSITGIVDGFREGITTRRGGVPILGKPDLYFINAEGAHVIHDWKVNGFCSKSAVSPVPGFVKIRDCYGGEPSRGAGVMHKDVLLIPFNGMMIDGSCYFENRKEDWAAQLSAYGWVMGEPVGKEIVVSLDQIVCKPDSSAVYPKLRVATHRSRVSQNYQFKILNDYQELWHRINAEPFHFFTELPYNQSVDKCKMLDMQAVDLYGIQADLTSDEAWLLDSAKERYGG